MRLKVSSAKRCPFCLSLNVLIPKPWGLCLLQILAKPPHPVWISNYTNMDLLDVITHPWSNSNNNSPKWVSDLGYGWSITSYKWATHIMHDNIIKWEHFPCYWPFVCGIQRWPVNSPHKGQWHGALMFSFICARINGWVIVMNAKMRVIIFTCPSYHDPSLAKYSPKFLQASAFCK